MSILVDMIGYKTCRSEVCCQILDRTLENLADNYKSGITTKEKKCPYKLLNNSNTAAHLSIILINQIELYNSS